MYLAALRKRCLEGSSCNTCRREAGNGILSAKALEVGVLFVTGQAIRHLVACKLFLIVFRGFA